MKYTIDAFAHLIDHITYVLMQLMKYNLSFVRGITEK